MTKYIKSEIKNNIFLNIIVSILYTLEYRYAYINFVIENYSYANLTFSPVSGSLLVLLLQASLPIFFYRGFRNVASGLSLFVYVFVYIPFVVTLHIAAMPFSFRITAGFVFLILMCIYFISDSYFTLTKFYIHKRRVFSFRSFEIIVIILFFITVFLNRGHISFENFLSEDNDLYSLRGENSILKLGIVNTYLTLWLSHAFLPILLVYYYIDKKKFKFFLCILGFVGMFMIDKQKITLLIPFVMWVLLYIYHIKKELIIRYFHAIIMSFMALTSFYFTYKSDNIENFALRNIAMLVVLRTQCIEGEQLDRYIQFFEVKDNPYTYYTHIRLVNKIANAYPYPKSIGEMVAGKEGSNSNATFLLMDGLASAGILGCILISFVFILIKSVLNSMGKKYQECLLLIILLFAIFSLLNTSLFTSLFSFGFIIIYMVLLLFKFPLLEK